MSALYKGNISIKPVYATLMGSVIAARAGIERKLAKAIGNGSAADGYKKIADADKGLAQLLLLLKAARDLAAHEELENHQAAFENLVAKCEDFVDQVNQLYPTGWDSCVSEKDFISATKSYSPFEKAVEIVFHEIKKKFAIELKEGMVLDGFHPYGMLSLDDRVRKLVTLEPAASS